MYLAHWNLKRHPFRNVPDTRFFFHSATHDAALAELLYAIDESLGAAFLVGPFGSGKSLVLRALLNGLGRTGHYRAGLLTNALMSGAEVVLSAARALGAADLPERAAEVSESHAQDQLEQRLMALHSTGVRAVLAIDDAQVIEAPAVWEALRLTLNIQLGERAPLTLLLAGGEELPGRVEGAPDFAERIAVRAALAPLSEEDALDYILHRLACAGAGRGIFTRKAAQNLVRLAGGLPARINQLADLSLAAAFGLGLAVVGPEIVDMVASDPSRGAARAAGER